VIVHPDFDGIVKNDIAIIELNSTVVNNLFVSPVCLPSGPTPTDGRICYATGYGEFSKFTNKLCWYKV